jgi:predicted DNA-binding transcriptional regulator AlpA
VKEFEFCIIATGLDPDADDFADRFFEAGCDDSTLGFQKGRITLYFTRDAHSIDAAICSAVVDVEKTGARVIRIEPDPLVSLSDIAERSGMTRAAFTQYAKGQRGENFPPPVARVTSESSLYDWAEVAAWLFRNGKLSLDQAVQAEAIKLVNEALANGGRVSATLPDKLKAYEARLNEAA